MGRTGKLWASEHSGVIPDMITTAKSLGGGMPISAIIGHASIMEAPHPGGLGGTYSGNPLACVAALAALDEITQPAFLARAPAVGERLRGRLLAIQAAHPRLVGDVRGLGPMLAMELVKDPDTKEPWLEATQAVNAGTLQRGVITIRAGLFSNCVRLLPPLNMTDAEIDEAMDVLSDHRRRRRRADGGHDHRRTRACSSAAPAPAPSTAVAGRSSIRRRRRSIAEMPYGRRGRRAGRPRRRRRGVPGLVRTPPTSAAPCSSAPRSSSPPASTNTPGAPPRSPASRSPSRAASGPARRTTCASPPRRPAGWAAAGSPRACPAVAST